MNFEGTVMQDFKETKLALLDRTTVSDGYGGFTVKWVEGARFSGVLTQPKNLNQEVAKADTGKYSYTLATSTNIKLKKDTYFRRLSDGKDFVIENDNYNRLAPDDSALQMFATTAHEVTLPND